MIEDLEVDLTKAPIDASNPDDLEVAETENYYESIAPVAKAINEMEIDLK